MIPDLFCVALIVALIWLLLDWKLRKFEGQRAILAQVEAEHNIESKQP